MSLVLGAIFVLGFFQDDGGFRHREFLQVISYYSGTSGIRIVASTDKQSEMHEKRAEELLLWEKELYVFQIVQVRVVDLNCYVGFN